MKTAFKVFIAILIVGLVLGIIGLAITGFDLNKFKSDPNSTKVEKQETLGSKSQITIDAENNEISFSVSSDDDIHITYYESDDYIVSYQADEEKIDISAQYKKRWLTWGVTKNHPITVSLPSAFNGSLDAQTNNGKISINSSGVVFSGITFTTNNGKISLDNVVCEGNIDVQSDNGEISFKNVEGKNLMADVNNGKVKGRNIKGDSIVFGTDNGEIDATDILSPHIELSSSNGNIKGTIIGNSDDYKAVLSVSLGNIKYNAQSMGSQTINPSAPKYIKAKTSMGSVDISFKEPPLG
ncbi:MAG: DUF4097 family beta strand repeat-containing protein [Clostridia bacterium]